jgi:hypothetical protein
MSPSELGAVPWFDSAFRDFRLEADGRGERRRYQAMPFTLLEHVQGPSSIGARRNDEPRTQNDLGEPSDTILPVHSTRSGNVKADKSHLGRTRD